MRYRNLDEVDNGRDNSGVYRRKAHVTLEGKGKTYACKILRPINGELKLHRIHSGLLLDRYESQRIFVSKAMRKYRKKAHSTAY